MRLAEARIWIPSIGEFEVALFRAKVEGDPVYVRPKNVYSKGAYRSTFWLHSSLRRAIAKAMVDRLVSDLAE